MTRFDGIDVLRFLSAVSVMAFHYGLAFEAEATLYGRFGVQIFFVISGLVIAMSMEGREALSFAKARFLRLYPAFWVCCLITSGFLMATESGPDAMTLLANFTMVPRAFGYDMLDGVYWTLAVELRFYALMALTLALRINLLAVLGVWLALSMFPNPIATKVLAVQWAPYFVVGATIYALRAKQNRALKFALLAVAVVLCAKEAWRSTLLYQQTLDPNYNQWISVAVILGGITAVIAALYVRKIPYAKTIGAMTYPLYLIHAEIGRSIIGEPVIWRVAAVAIAMIATAWFVSIYLERPLSRLIARAIERRPILSAG